MAETGPPDDPSEDERLRRWREERRRIAAEERDRRLVKELDTGAPAIPKPEIPVDLRNLRIKAPDPGHEPAEPNASTTNEIDEIQARMAIWRRARWHRALALFVVCVLAPLAAVFGWLTLATKPLYETRAVLTISQPKQESQTAPPGLLGAIGAPQGMAQVFMADEFVRSPALVSAVLDPALAPRLAAEGLGDLVLLSHDALASQIDSSVNIQTGMMTVYARMPEPAQAVALARLVLDLVSTHVDDLGADLRDKRLSVAQDSVNEARASLIEAKRALVALQIEHGELDPRTRIEGIYQMIAGTESEIVALRTELGRVEVAGSGDSYEAKRLRELLEKLDALVERERRSLLEPRGGTTSLNALLMDYETANQTVSIAEETLSAALASLASAQSEVALGRSVLQVVVPPLAPGKPEYPRIMVALFITLVIGLAVFFTARLVLFDPD
ncbi:hypothetical protein NHN26_16615 [Rhodovulum tesquicola]|uniref:Capsule polysaccharide export protein KpsE/RkpR n=1 Tax=Rhodovulum steppense TaxID=540251 RepID=A0A4V2R4R6_9RHOB|nr:MULTISPECIES: hypothetical protein [Rhodovulum]MCO8146833.1 hypothetical protein [Rhodovulum tesquicola]TCM85524.1 capsule polysaccharide export protein KpsE/RkpR [Rhodovulum steppense]